MNGENMEDEKITHVSSGESSESKHLRIFCKNKHLMWEGDVREEKQAFDSRCKECGERGHTVEPLQGDVTDKLHILSFKSLLNPDVASFELQKRKGCEFKSRKVKRGSITHCPRCGKIGQYKVTKTIIQGMVVTEEFFEGEPKPQNALALKCDCGMELMCRELSLGTGIFIHEGEIN